MGSMIQVITGALGAYFIVKTSNLDCNLFIAACLIKMPYGKK